MKILSWNVRGLNNYKKRLKIKKFIQKHCPDIVLLQETKLQQTDESIIKSLWSSKDIGWTQIDAVGSSGGVITLWDEWQDPIAGNPSITISCSFSNLQNLRVTNVYGPTNYKERKFLWQELKDVQGFADRFWCVGGDFNVTRWIGDRSSGRRISKAMRVFNSVIETLEIVEIPLYNGRFTWSKMGNDSVHSLIDRFFVSVDWASLFNNSRVYRAERITSDHFPIFLDAGDSTWGPCSFRYFNTWLSAKDCVSLIESKLSNDHSYGWAGYAISLKLRNLKSSLKHWHHQNEAARKASEDKIIEEINLIDLLAESSELN